MSTCKVVQIERLRSSVDVTVEREEEVGRILRMLLG